jgi:hypothetical protein
LGFELEGGKNTLEIDKRTTWKAAQGSAEDFVDLEICMELHLPQFRQLRFSLASRDTYSRIPASQEQQNAVSKLEALGVINVGITAGQRLFDWSHRPHCTPILP